MKLKRSNLKTGQLLKPGQKFFGTNFGGKIEARSSHLWGQGRPMGPGIYIMVCREKYATCKSIMSTFNIIICGTTYLCWMPTSLCLLSRISPCQLNYLACSLHFKYNLSTIIREKYTTRCIRYLIFAINVIFYNLKGMTSSYLRSGLGLILYLL